MKRQRTFLMMIAIILTLLLLCSCAAPAAPEATSTPSPTVTDTPAPTAAPTATPTATPAAETATPAATMAATATPTSAPSPTPKGPAMYSSYADLISFDPETGIAKFDYFDMLRGADAVKFLVDHEGYTQTAAQKMVDDFADSEFVKKNTNPQLRAIDIDDVPLKLMVKPSGDPVDGGRLPDADGAAAALLPGAGEAEVGGRHGRYRRRDPRTGSPVESGLT